MLFETPLPLSNTETMVILYDSTSVQNWAKVFGVSEIDVAIAVQRAGVHADDVAMFLGKPWR